MLRRLLDGSLTFRVRWLAFLALAWAIAAGTAAWNGRLWAQEEGAGPAAAPPAAAPAARPPAPAAPVTPKDMKLLDFYYDALGPFYTVTFLAISFTFVALV